MIVRLTLGLVLVAALAGLGAATRGLELIGEARPAGQELLYLPNGRLLRVASLGQAPLLADAIYLWAIQFYSDYGREDRLRYVEHVFGNVISELDPHYIDPYWMGAMILSVEAGDLDGALRLLEKGFEKNPQEWVLPYLAGWECYHARQFTRAARYFEQAAAVESAPPVVLRVRAGVISRAGDLRSSAELWRDVLEDPRSDPASIAIAKRQIRDLTVRADVADLRRAVERFRLENSGWPRRLSELVAAGYLDVVPVDPDGQPYAYDPRSGSVSSTAGRVLGASR